MAAYVVAALYKFVSLPDYRTLRQPLLDQCRTLAIKGTLLLAREGINGTIAGRRTAIEQWLATLQHDERFADLQPKVSLSDEMPFYRMKVKLKQEIVSMGVPAADPARLAGEYVDATDWNDLISDPATLLIDTRNYYECAIGRFKEAISPQTTTFREFPDFVDQQLDPARHKKVAMYCTGGIRCEKATAYLRRQGFEEVYHLRGGILQYLQTVAPEDSLWTGECFVFDNRVTVDHRLDPGSYRQCFACRMPLSVADRQSEHYRAGVACPYCYDKTSAEQKARFGERQRQIRLAKERHQPYFACAQPATAAADQGGSDDG